MIKVGVMDNNKECIVNQPETEPVFEKQTYVVINKEEVIEILKTLEGLKRKLQPLVKT